MFNFFKSLFSTSQKMSSDISNVNINQEDDFEIIDKKSNSLYDYYKELFDDKDVCNAYVLDPIDSDNVTECRVKYDVNDDIIDCEFCVFLYGVSFGE